MLVAILLVFVTSYYYFNLDSSPDIATQVSEKDGMTMLYVPEGEFLMGVPLDAPGADDDEKPQRKVYLDAFWIDQTEVTNEMFERFVRGTGYETDAEKEDWGWVCIDGNCNKTEGANWLHPHGAQSHLDGLEKHPVVQVSWYDAQAYCEWAERRLPTEAEWEKAARGTDGYHYPWGKQDIAGTLVNFCDSNCSLPNADQSIDDGYEFTAPVGSYPAGASLYNALDMAGNVWEWVADWYDERYYQNAPLRNPQGPDYGESRTQRSGSWDNGIDLLNAANRVPALPSDRNYSRGFRCATSP
jgi:formylglycine-generating enzyme required for sulfatase activity